MKVIHRVQVRCLTPREGGCETPIRSGYKSLCFWGQEEGVTAQLTFPYTAQRESLWGQRTAELILLVEDVVIPDRFSFIIREGRRISAYGKVLGSRTV